MKSKARLSLILIAFAILSSQVQATTFFDGFETGSFGTNWTPDSNTVDGNVAVGITGGCFSANTGNYYAILSESDYTQNILKSNYDFSGSSDYNLSFYTIEGSTGAGDENDGGSCADHSGDIPPIQCDGLAFTCNGTDWFVVWTTPDAFSSWTRVDVNLSDDPDFCSSVTSSFAIKFMQYDNFTCPTDGIAIDDVNLSFTASASSPSSTSTTYAITGVTRTIIGLIPLLGATLVFLLAFLLLQQEMTDPYATIVTRSITLGRIAYSFLASLLIFIILTAVISVVLGATV